MARPCLVSNPLQLLADTRPVWEPSAVAPSHDTASVRLPERAGLTVGSIPGLEAGERLPQRETLRRLAIIAAGQRQPKQALRNASAGIVLRHVASLEACGPSPGLLRQP